MPSCEIFFHWCLTLLCAGNVALAGSTDLTTNGVEWRTNYYAPSAEGGDGLPDDAERTSPPWDWTTKEGAERGQLALEADCLEFNTLTSGTEDCYSAPFGTAGSDSATLEFTVQVASTAGDSYYAGGIYVGLGTHAWSLQFGTGAQYALQWGGKSYTAAELGGVDFREVTTFRIVMENMTTPSATASLHINHSPSPVLVLDASGMSTPAYSQTITFGQTADRANQAGVVHWHGIRWAPHEAIPPSAP